MKIKNHLLYTAQDNQIPFVRSPNQKGHLSPNYVIMHYTAGSSAESSIRHLTKKSSNASAHIVIGRDGSITQLVPFNRIAWHAGRSKWHGLSGLNKYSIGIELDNAGPLENSSGKWRSWFGRAYSAEDVLVATHKHEDKERGWQRYTEEQISAALVVTETIIDQYQIVDILGHDDIAPKRKQDPGPAFPLDHFQSQLLGREQEDPEIFETIAPLNVRDGPGTQFPKLDGSPLKKGTRMELERRESNWCYVDVLDHNGSPTASGWVHGNYITPV